ISLSPVLQAMGIAPETGQGAVRFSLGRWTTREEIDLAVAALERAIR
ncbi:MAG: cysteine desulfurase NifS, partial [Nitrospinota bacterium]